MVFNEVESFTHTLYCSASLDRTSEWKRWTKPLLPFEMKTVKHPQPGWAWIWGMICWPVSSVVHQFNGIERKAKGLHTLKTALREFLPVVVLSQPESPNRGNFTFFQEELKVLHKVHWGTLFWSLRKPQNVKQSAQTLEVQDFPVKSKVVWGENDDRRWWQKWPGMCWQESIQCGPSAVQRGPKIQSLNSANL